jgi:hypothetical protein
MAQYGIKQRVFADSAKMYGNGENCDNWLAMLCNGGGTA